MIIDRETIIKLEREAFDRPINNPSEAIDAMEHFAKLVAEHSASVEREACAKVAEQADNCMNDPYENAAAREIATAIRARGNT